MGLLVEIFLQAFTVGLSGAMMPGPLLTYNIQLSYKKGFWVGPQMVLGHAFLEMGLIGAVMGGLGSILTRPLTKLILWLVGGVLLGWMGYDLIWRESRNPLTALEETAATGELANKGSRLTNIHPVMAGAVISFSNPYWSLWWATIGLGFISKAFVLGWAGVLSFFAGHILSDLLWYSLISAAVANGRKYISGSLYKGLLIGCGVFLLLIAAGFIWDALQAMEWIRDLFERTIDLFPKKQKLI